MVSPLSLSAKWRHREKVGWIKSRREPSPGNWIFLDHDLGLLSCYDYKKNICCLSHSVYDILLWKPKLTKTHTDINKWLNEWQNMGKGNKLWRIPNNLCRFSPSRRRSITPISTGYTSDFIQEDGMKRKWE